MYIRLCLQFFSLRKRNRKYVLYILLGISIFWIFFTRDHNNSATNKELQSRLEQEFLAIENDAEIDTSNYLEGYNQFLQQRSRFKSNTYQANYHLKRELNNSPHRSGQINKSSYLIHEYTPFMGTSKYCHLYDNNNKPADLILKQCPYTNCQFTCDANRIDEADMLLFHEADAKNLIASDPKYVERVLKVRSEHPRAIFTLWNDEANYVTERLDPIKFNWTISFRLDSEISDCAYGCIYKRAKKLDRNQFEETMWNEFGQRSDHALWFVSNCDSKKRIDFALAVHSQFPVRIFGACKLLTEWQNALGFSRDSLLGWIMSKAAIGLGGLIQYGKCGAFRGHGNCEVKEFDEAKFFFSFESKNCSNLYVTEKFYRILRHNIVPVLLQPNREFYEKIAPPNSFIHAQDFDFDPERLGLYLQKVIQILEGPMDNGC